MSAAAGVLSFAAVHMIYNIVILFETIRPVGRQMIFISALIGFVAAAAAGYLLPRLLEGVRQGVCSTRPFGLSAGVLAIAIACYAPVVRFFGVEAWMGNVAVRLVVGAGAGTALALGYCLFFSLVPPGRRGLWLGAAIASGPLAKCLVERLAIGVEGMDAPDAIYRTAQVLAAVAAATQVLGIFLLARRGPGNGGGESPAPTPLVGALYEPARSAGFPPVVIRLLAATGLFFLLTGMQAGRLFPYMNAELGGRSALMPVLYVVLTPLAGWLFDRDLPAWFKRLIWPCAVLFMFVPVLPLLRAPSVELYRIVHALVIFAHLAVFVGMTLVVEQYAGRGRFWCLAVMAPHLSQSLVIAWMALDEADSAFELSVKTLLSVVTAVAFYELVKLPSLREPALTAVPAAGGIAPSPPETASRAEPAAEEKETDRSTRALYKKFRLTDREMEVADMVLRGMSTAEMAKNMFVSEVTVRFHVKNILHKCHAPNRRVFQARVFSGELWGEAAEI